MLLLLLLLLLLLRAWSHRLLLVRSLRVPLPLPYGLVLLPLLALLLLRPLGCRCPLRR